MLSDGGDNDVDSVMDWLAGRFSVLSTDVDSEEDSESDKDNGFLDDALTFFRFLLFAVIRRSSSASWASFCWKRRLSGVSWRRQIKIRLGLEMVSSKLLIVSCYFQMPNAIQTIRYVGLNPYT